MIKILSGVFRYSAGVLLLSLLTLLFADALFRNLFNSPIKGAGELAGLIQVGLIFISFPVIAARNDHITVDIFDEILGPRINVLQKYLAGFLGLLFFAVLGWQSAKLGTRFFQYGDNTGYLEFPTGVLFWFISGMCGLTSLGFILGIFNKPDQNTDNDHANSGEL